MKHNQKLKHKAKQEIVRKALQDGNDEKGSTKKQKSKRIKPATDPVEDDGQADEDDIDVDLLDGDGTDDNAAMQDQGFCRPRILILAPLRGSAKDVIDWMIELFGENTTIINEERYDEEYGLPEEDDDDLLKTKPPEKKNKPLDWQALFENRNIDDDFKVKPFSIHPLNCLDKIRCSDGNTD